MDEEIIKRHNDATVVSSIFNDLGKLAEQLAEVTDKVDRLSGQLSAIAGRENWLVSRINDTEQATTNVAKTLEFTTHALTVQVDNVTDHLTRTTDPILTRLDRVEARVISMMRVVGKWVEEDRTVEREWPIQLEEKLPAEFIFSANSQWVVKLGSNQYVLRGDAHCPFEQGKRYEVRLLAREVDDRHD